MQIYPTMFPEHRRTDPTRQAELRVYNELLNSDLDGLAVYGSKPTPNSPEVDNAIWLPNNARLSDEVKGGAYSLQGGEWMLHSVGGPKVVDSPVVQARDAAIGMRTAIKEILGRAVYVYAVLQFTDMEPDNHILAQANRHQVHVVWGVEGLPARLIEIAGSKKILVPPAETEIEEEARLFVPGLKYQGTESKESADVTNDRDTDAGQVIAQRIDTVNIYINGGKIVLVRQDWPDKE